MTVPIKNKMGALKSTAQRFVDSMKRQLERLEWDDEYYIWSVFMANIESAVEIAEEAIEHWPEGVK